MLIGVLMSPGENGIEVEMLDVIGDGVNLTETEMKDICEVGYPDCDYNIYEIKADSVHTVIKPKVSSRNLREKPLYAVFRTSVVNIEDMLVESGKEKLLLESLDIQLDLDECAVCRLELY